MVGVTETAISVIPLAELPGPSSGSQGAFQCELNCKFKGNSMPNLKAILEVGKLWQITCKLQKNQATSCLVTVKKLRANY